MVSCLCTTQTEDHIFVQCFFYEIFSSALAYTLKPYAEDMVMRTAVSYTPYATSSMEQNSNIITFAQFEEGDLPSENCNYTEISNESDDDSTLAQLIIG